MNELRTLFPKQIVRGALLRADGLAVGLVSGGAPAWDMLAQSERAQVGDDYHRLLLALEAPVDCYLIDLAPDVAGAVATLYERQARAEQPALAAISNAMADYLTELSYQSSSRAKQVIWTVTAGGSVPAWEWAARAGRRRSAAASSSRPLTQAVEQARRLADALSQLGARPAPRLMEAEEIARLLYTLADPVRAQHYPLAGTLLERVRRIIDTGEEQYHGAA